MIVRDKVFVGFVNEGVTQTIAPGAIAIRYVSDMEPEPVEVHSEALAAPEFDIDLKPLVGGAIVPNSLSFRMNGKIYADRAGVLMHSIDPATGVGTIGGSINYSTGVIRINSWESGPLAFHLTSGLINPGTPGQAMVSGRSAARPLKPSSLFVSAVSLDGGTLTATAAADGTLAGTKLEGFVDVESGIYQIRFGEWIPDPDDTSGSPPLIWRPILVDPATLRYNGVAYTYLPLDADLLGLDPVRLPSDGRVPIFRAGEYAVVGRDIESGPHTVSNGQTINLGATRLSRVRVVGAGGLGISGGWSRDLDAGTVTFTDVTGYSQPVTIVARQEDMLRVSDVQINGQVSFTRPLTHAFETGCTVSSALMLGDRRARVSALWDQQTWDNTWQDSIKGSFATGTYDDGLFPVQVTNAGAVTERWAIRFDSTTAVSVIGEHAGLIYSGPISSDVAPLNPASGTPYFRMLAGGFGAGWSVGNIIRINTEAAGAPIWCLQTVQQGASAVMDDAWELLARADVNRP